MGKGEQGHARSVAAKVEMPRFPRYWGNESKAKVESSLNKFFVIIKWSEVLLYKPFFSKRCPNPGWG
jgi:hypothetical protein